MTDKLDRLCQYFGCSLEQSAEYVPGEEVGQKKEDDGKPKAIISEHYPKILRLLTR